MLSRSRLVWLLLLLVWCQSSLAQPATWQRVKLDSVASIAFPDSVTRKQVKGQVVYVCQTGPTLCLVVSQSGHSLLGLLGNTEDFRSGMVEGLLQETKGHLLAKRFIQIGDFKGVEVQFTTPTKPELPTTKFTRMVMVNGTVYSLNYWTNAAPTATSAAERDRFFASFKVNAKPEILGDDARNLGYLVGRLFAYLALAGLLLGAVLLIRRRAAHK